MTIQKYREFIQDSRMKIVNIINGRIIPGIKDIVEFYDTNLKNWKVYGLNMDHPNIDNIKICVELEFEKPWDDDVDGSTIHSRIESEFGDDILESFIEIDQFDINIRYQKDELRESDIFINITYDPVITSIKNPIGDMIIKRIMSEFGHDLVLIDHDLWWSHALPSLVKHRIHLAFK